MSTKREGVACYDKAAMDEPLFVLRAQDKLAAGVVRWWATLAAAGGTKPEIVAEALRCAEQMEAWPYHKHPGMSVERYAPTAPTCASCGCQMGHNGEIFVCPNCGDTSAHS